MLLDSFGVVFVQQTRQFFGMKDAGTELVLTTLEVPHSPRS